MDKWHSSDYGNADEERRRFVAAVKSLALGTSSEEGQTRTSGSAEEACIALSFDQPIVKQEDLIALLKLLHGKTDLRLEHLPPLSTRLVKNAASLARKSVRTTKKDSQMELEINDIALYSELCVCLMGRVARCLLEEVRRGNAIALSKVIRPEFGCVHESVSHPVAEHGEDKDEVGDPELPLEDHVLAAEEDSDDFEFMSLDSQSRSSQESAAQNLNSSAGDRHDNREAMDGLQLATKYLLECLCLVEYDLFTALGKDRLEQLHIVEDVAKVVKECWQLTNDHCLRAMSLPYLAVIQHHIMAHPKAACSALQTMTAEFGNVLELNLLVGENTAMLDHFSLLVCSKLDGQSTRAAVHFYQECLHSLVSKTMVSPYGGDALTSLAGLIVPALSCLNFYVRYGPQETVANHLLKCGLWRDLVQLSVSTRSTHHVLLAGCCRCPPLANFTLRVPNIMPSLMAEECPTLGNRFIWSFLQAKQDGFPTKSAGELATLFSAVIDQVRLAKECPELALIDAIVQVLDYFLLMRHAAVVTFQCELQALLRNCQQWLQVLSQSTGHEVNDTTDECSDSSEHKRQLHSVVKGRLRTVVTLLKELLAAESSAKLD